MQRPMAESGMRLEIREDKEAGVIRANFADNSGAERMPKREVATLSTELAKSVPGLFEVWSQSIGVALACLIEEATGQTVRGFDFKKPGEKS